MAMGSGVIVAEELEPGIRYIEEQSRTDRGVPVRDCFLVADSKDEPISTLDLRAFEQRFGAVSIPMEGIGGVETQPMFRRHGWMSKLLARALTRAAERVNVAGIGNAIPGIYEKHGFMNCVVDRELLVDVASVAALGAPCASELRTPRALAESDIPGIIALYNEVHADRPWTHRRARNWNRFVPQKTWHPGSEAIVIEYAGRVAAYAIFIRPLYGHRKPELRVDEMAAHDRASASALISAIAGLSAQGHQGQFSVAEPLDCVVGRTLKDLGCTLRETHYSSGGMMARILHVKPLLQILEPELRRRCRGLVPDSHHEAAFEALMAGTLGVGSETLLPLLVGHLSLADLKSRGLSVSRFEDVLHLWFSGGASQRLPTAHAHRLDRY